MGETIIPYAEGESHKEPAWSYFVATAMAFGLVQEAAFVLADNVLALRKSFREHKDDPRLPGMVGPQFFFALEGEEKPALPVMESLGQKIVNLTLFPRSSQSLYFNDYVEWLEKEFGEEVLRRFEVIRAELVRLNRY